MNIIEINPSGGETLVRYVEGAVGLTLVAAWVSVALQVESIFFPRGSPAWKRASWPVFYVWDLLLWIYRQRPGGRQETTRRG